MVNVLQKLSNHQTILYPTDTVYGIGCDATSETAVKKIYATKQREESKALICLVSDIDMLNTYVQNIPKNIVNFLKTTTKPTTIIYNNPKGLASNLVASDNTIAIRIVSKGFAHNLIKQFKKPIVSTSANISGEPTPKSFNEISSQILNNVDYIVNLSCESTAVPSTILKLNDDGKITVIRE